jgi:hypothetical protein
MEKKYLALYYVLWSNMTLESRSKVLQLTEFNESERDVFRLWQAIINTHQNTGYDGVFNKFHARDNYRRIYMGKDELLDRFKQRYDDALNLLRSAKQSVPPEDEQAMDFIYKLDNKKFIRFRTELHNQVINRIAEFPTTLSDAYYRAGQWKEVAYNTGSGGGGEHMRIINPGERAAAFPVNTQTNNNNQKPSSKGEDNNNSSTANHHNKDFKCFNCGKLGHKKARECPDKKGNRNNNNNNRNNNGKPSNNDEVTRRINLITTAFTGAHKDSEEVVAIEPFDVLLDNQSTINIFNDSMLLKNIRTTNQIIHIHYVGMVYRVIVMQSNF